MSSRQQSAEIHQGSLQTEPCEACKRYSLDALFVMLFLGGPPSAAVHRWPSGRKVIRQQRMYACMCVGVGNAIRSGLTSGRTIDWKELIRTPAQATWPSHKQAYATAWLTEREQSKGGRYLH